MIADHADFPILSLDVDASSDLAGNRMVTLSGAYPAVGGLAIGATKKAIDAGQRGALAVHGIARVEAGSEFGKDVPLMCGPNGTVVAHDANAAHFPVGRSLATAAAGGVVSVWLTPCAGAQGVAV